MNLSTALLALVAFTSGCAAMEKAYNDELDRSVAVTSGAEPWRYGRVLVETPSCQGELCDTLQPDMVESAVQRGLTGACYEVVAQEEYRRTVRYYRQRGAILRTHTDFGDVRFEVGPDGMAVGVPGFDMDVRGDAGALEPDMRDLVTAELGLDAMVKSTLDIGPPDSVTGFREATLDVRMVDAAGRSTVWHARHPRTLMENADVSTVVNQLTDEVMKAIGRKAGACNPPVVPEEHRVDSVVVVDEQIKIPGHVYFELGSTKLSARSHGVLNEVAGYLAEHPELSRIRVEGHTDDIGEAAYNLKLSKGRAQSVSDYLVSRGIDAARLTVEGFGETKPLVANATEADRATNRRVELHILK